MIGGDSGEEGEAAGGGAAGRFDRRDAAGESVGDGADDGALPPVPDLDGEADPEIRAAREELRAALAIEQNATRAARAAARAKGPVVAVVDRYGDALPLASDDEALLPSVPADYMDEETARRASQALRYHARSLRSTYDSDELGMYALALEREFGSELELSDIEDGLRATDYRVGEDPLLDSSVPLPFNVDALAFRTHMKWSGPPGRDQLDRCGARREGGFVCGVGPRVYWDCALSCLDILGMG